LLILYSKPNCPWCERAEELLRNKNIEFQKKTLDVDYVRAYLLELVDKYKGTTYPLTLPKIIDDENSVYFDSYDKLKEYYERQ